MINRIRFEFAESWLRDSFFQPNREFENPFLEAILYHKFYLEISSLQFLDCVLLQLRSFNSLIYKLK